jgi:type II secretory pathway component GspD/PulD (secretin)
MRGRAASACLCVLLSLIAMSAAAAQATGTQGAKLTVTQAGEAKPAEPDSITLRIVNTELRSAVQMIQQYLDKPVIYSGPGAGPQVTLESPKPVPRAEIPRLLRGLLDSQGYELVDDTTSGTYRARPKEVPRPTPTMPQQFPGQPSLTNAGSGPKQPGTPQLFVIALKHARASDVATTINALFGRQTGSQLGGFGGAPSRMPTLGDELRMNQVPPPDIAPLPQSVPGVAGRAATITGDVIIVPDTRGNTLLIRANRSDFELIQAAVQQIDVRPLQVLIEVMIVEARRDRSFALSLEAAVVDQHVKGTDHTTIGGAYTPGTTGSDDFTIHVAGFGSSALSATLSAAAGRGDVKIVSRPVVLAANDEQAEVVVGSQRPFVQVSRSSPIDATLRDEVVQYRDVGTKLNVRPTISGDGSVQLSVAQEVSTATAETQFNAPVISTRSVRTDLLVKDGQTIALGGLTDRERDIESGGVPLLSSIPFVGGFFGRHSRSTTETELFIFLTPRVIRTDEDAERLTDPMKKRADEVKP